MQYCDNIDTFAKKIGAVNTVVHEKNALTGYNTDCIGIIKALEKNTEIQNKRVAIFGSGGAAKSAVIALLSHTKHICLFNRTKDKNKEFAKKNSIDYDGLEAFQPNNFDIIINATTVGLNEEKSILNAGQILDTHTVFDMVYSPHETQLLQIASQKGAQKVYGIEMLIFQAMEQFKLYTNQIPNEHTMRNAVQKKHSKKCIVVM